MGRATQNTAPSLEDLDSHLIRGSLGPPESTIPSASHWFSRFCRAHECDQQTDRPRYSVCIYTVKGNGCDILYNRVGEMPSSVVRCLSIQTDIPQILWLVADTTAHRRLPSQLHSTSTIPWLVFMSNPAELDSSGSVDIWRAKSPRSWRRKSSQ